MSTMVQVALASGTSRRTCWVPTDKRPRVGSMVTLKNSENADRLWTVQSMSEPKDSADLRTDWRVGGL